MMESISREQLERVLVKAGVLKGWKSINRPGIQRTAICQALDLEFEIEWWVNICYLHIGSAIVIFKDVRESDTWPTTGWKRELRFIDSIPDGLGDGNIVALIPIEMMSK